MPRDPARYRDHDLCFDADEATLPREVGARFVRLDLDGETREYIDRAIAARPGRARTRAHQLLLGLFSDFDANGLLGMYPMHLLGTEQWRTLVGESPGRRHLDIGAGSGDVTARLSPLSGETVTTEMSRVMAKNLRKRGFRCERIDVAEAGVPDPRYDLVTCLNVLDRCPKPRSLLARARDALTADGRLVLATPLPFRPFYYDGPRSLDPIEKLPIAGETWETSLIALIESVLDPVGLEVESVSRAPYLSGGDARRELYVLDDAILVCKKRA